MTHEVGLYAGIAVVAMVQDSFRPDFPATGRSPHVLRFIQAAISKLSQHLLADNDDAKRRRVDAGSGDAAIIAAMFLGHIAVSLFRSVVTGHSRLHRELQHGHVMLYPYVGTLADLHMSETEQLWRHRCISFASPRGEVDG